jgi:DNA polymerase-3 subunit alpha (Gram-positive type)
MSSRRWIAFDCETTGLLPHARLLEIGAVAFRESGVIESEFQRLVRPPVVLPQFVVELTGITQDMIRDAETSAIVLKQFLDWLPHRGILVGHNVAFDLAAIENEDRHLLDRLRLNYVDSLAIARRMGEFPDNRLETIAGVLQKDANRSRHRALEDAHVVRELMLRALSRGYDQSHPELFERKPASRFLLRERALRRNDAPRRVC